MGALHPEHVQALENIRVHRHKLVHELANFLAGLGVTTTVPGVPPDRYGWSAMDTGVTTIAELRASMTRDRRKAWVRVLLGAEEDGVAPLRSGQILVGPKPEGWEPRRWTYREWTFVATEMTARGVAALLTAGDIQELKVGERTATLTLFDSAQWLRHPSRQTYGGIELPWPSRTVTLSAGDGHISSPGGYMVGSEGPSFPSFAGAYSAFFYDQWAHWGANQPTFGQMALHIVDGRARIRRVVVRAASLDVWVDGRTARGCRLELNSSQDRQETIVQRSGKVSLPLRSGLGNDPWLWLKDETDWIDYRQIIRRGGQQGADVEFEAPEDPVAEITALATQGETAHLEYKRDLPEDSADSKRKVLKTVVAFANGDGGTMLFGVDGDDDTGEIVGLAGKPAVLQRRLNDLVRDRVSPAPTFHIAGRKIDDRFVIRLDVSPGGRTLHALVLEANKPEYYVRRNGSTYFARPEELAQVVSKAYQQPYGGLRDLL